MAEIYLYFSHKFGQKSINMIKTLIINALQINLSYFWIYFIEFSFERAAWFCKAANSSWSFRISC